MTNAIEGIAADSLGGPGLYPDARRAPLRAAGPVVQPIGLPELHAHDDAVPAAANAPIVRDWNPLHQIKATLQAWVGEASLTVGELLAAKEHQVLRLDRAVDQPVDLTIEGKVVARGQLVAVDGHFAVRITELPIALDLSQAS